MSVSKWDGAFGDLTGRMDSGHEVNQMFTEAERSGQGPWVGWGRGRRVWNGGQTFPGHPGLLAVLEVLMKAGAGSVLMGCG